MFPQPPMSTLFPYTTLFRSATALRATGPTACTTSPRYTTLSMNSIMLLTISATKHRLLHSSSPARSEEHTSELQSQSNLVCRLLLEKKNHASLCVIYGDKCS